MWRLRVNHKHRPDIPAFRRLRLTRFNIKTATKGQVNTIKRQTKSKTQSNPKGKASTRRSTLTGAGCQTLPMGTESFHFVTLGWYLIHRWEDEAHSDRFPREQTGRGLSVMSVWDTALQSWSRVSQHVQITDLGEAGAHWRQKAQDRKESNTSPTDRPTRGWQGNTGTCTRPALGLL